EMYKNFILICSLIMMIFFHADPVFAAGWGFKKSTDNKIPDIGSYENVLKRNLAFYADKHTKKDIYLTFDNGYEDGYTKDSLMILKEENTPATFFVTGNYVEEEPELIKQMDEDAHIIGSHSYHHPEFTSLNKTEIKKELDDVEEAVVDITGNDSMKFVRPPRGTFNEDILKWTEELGYVSVFWSLAFKDWERNKQKGETYAYEQIMEQIHPRAMILLHMLAEDNAKALQQVIQQLKKEGYTFKSLDDLLWKELLSKDIRF